MSASNPQLGATTRRARPTSLVWVIAITGAAQFMGSLDNLVVTFALPVIRRSLHAGLAGLEWTVNAYTLSFAVLLLTGAALGDRFGRRRMFVVGIGIFTVASAVAALAPNIDVLIAARAVQGAGGALLIPLSLTLLSAAVPEARRNVALGVWGAIGGLAVAIGPLVGGAVVEGLSWQWIFWLNVPIGVALLPLAWTRLDESHGDSRRLDLRGIVFASVGLFGIVFGLVRGGDVGWTNTQILASFAVGVSALVGFIIFELRSDHAMLPMALFRRRGFSVVNGVSLFMSFGMFGSIFFLAQFLQTVQGYSPLSAGVRTLPWTAMPVLVAPFTGPLVEKFGGRTLITLGLALQAIGLAWIAFVISPGTGYLDFVPAFVISGVGMSLFFVPVASVLLSSVPRVAEGVASGTNNAIRELGGVFGISVLGALFASFGSYASGLTYVAGLLPALRVGISVVAAGAILAAVLPRPARRELAESELELEAA
ncbi:MAG: DHA2 family efflux MFS transporter permease subunit [Acidimicrobiales bacterium]